MGQNQHKCFHNPLHRRLQSFLFLQLQSFFDLREVQGQKSRHHKLASYERYNGLIEKAGHQIYLQYLLFQGDLQIGPYL